MYVIDRDGYDWLFKLYTLDKRLVRVSRHRKKYQALQQAQYLRMHLLPADRDFMKGIV